VTRQPEDPAAAAAEAVSAMLQAGGPGDILPDSLILMLRELCHELRNPLTVILGFSERIRDGGVRHPDKIQSYAANIVQSAGLAMDILADFSDRILRPLAHPPDPEPAEVRPVVISCLQLIAPLAAQAGLKVSRSVPNGLGALNITERALRQILLNLLLNAVRHQKTGGMVRVVVRKRWDGAARIKVSDDGIGMTKKEIKAVMSGRPAPAVPQPGRSGLGLPLVKRLTEAAGGTLAIESARRKGTTVQIILPPSGAAAGE
jgi:signal transduction histidine kinase